MTSKTLPTPSAGAGDIVKYVVALLLVAAGLFAFYWFEGQWPGGVRVLAVIAGLVAGAAVFLLTAKGADTRDFLSESRFELRKVVWPTRQETMRTTWIVMLVVVIISLLLGGFDLVISSLTKLLWR